jgi:hypothetical protein
MLLSEGRGPSAGVLAGPDAEFGFAAFSWRGPVAARFFSSKVYVFLEGGLLPLIRGHLFVPGCGEVCPINGEDVIQRVRAGGVAAREGYRPVARPVSCSCGFATEFGGYVR